MAPKPASTAGKAPASTASKAPAKPAEGAKAAKKTSKPAALEEVRKETYSSYIYKGMAILNSFVNDIFERIATRFQYVYFYLVALSNDFLTRLSREIQTAVPISEGTKSVTTLNFLLRPLRVSPTKWDVRSAPLYAYSHEYTI
ncbi:hypothetical protein FA13DRAFT_1745336 [Coprinellus micaceus]|uniref:Histone H2B n=1 Tax=Coprinellus micaceus TaxID=71717 RepID=A0A4Y7SB04_COPMI|nr:hypothetical protein FA13DRAFT_1745336 [Coprinellus micaceus]